jgi:hypothetical protein
VLIRFSPTAVLDELDSIGEADVGTQVHIYCNALQCYALHCTALCYSDMCHVAMVYCWAMSYLMFYDEGSLT